MLQITYAVTFEFETRAPVTHRGTVKASHVATGARLAIKAAQAQLRPHNWTSMVFVALERAPVPSGEEPATDA